MMASVVQSHLEHRFYTWTLFFARPFLCFFWGGGEGNHPSEAGFLNIETHLPMSPGAANLTAHLVVERLWSSLRTHECII